MLIKNNTISFEYIKLYDLSKRVIGIPIFQRFYDWTEKQVQETLNNIEDALLDKSKEIYLLDFIWYEEDGKMKIADGQQRLVSINLLLKCIIDFIDSNDLKIEKPSLFSIQYDNFDYNIKYKQAFENYIVAPFKKMYLRLSEFVSIHAENIQDIIEILKNRIYIYLKKTENSDIAFSIFTQINTGGKPLTKDEVIRTAIDQYSTIYGVSVTYKVKDLRRAITSYYKYINSTSNSNFDTIAIMGFLKNYIVKSKQTFCDFIRYLNIISNISNYSISYIIDYINRSQLYDIVNIMGIKGIDLKVKKDYLIQIMFPLCLLSISMTMKKSNPGGIITSLYLKVISLLKDEQKPDIICGEIAAFINDNEEICKINYNDFVEALGKKDIGKRIKEALLIMDVIIRTTSSDLNVPSINLEHVYPQRPVPEWAMNGWPTSEEERSEVVNNIGNFLLLNEEVNKKIKNKYIDYKVSEYTRIIPKDLTLQTPMNTVDFVAFERDRVAYIKKRQGQIAEEIYNNFTLAKVILTR